MEKTFFFHAQGVGLGGVVTRPFQHLIDSRASASLPITGGRAAASSTRHVVPDLTDPKSKDLPHVVTIERAETDISGTRENNGIYRTVLTTLVHGLDVRGRVTADEVWAKLISEHRLDDDEPRITVEGRIDSLKIDGKPVAVEFMHETFSDLNTHSKFKNKFDQDQAFRRQMRRQFLWGDCEAKEIPDFLAEQYKFTDAQKSIPESKGIVPCSIVKGVKGGNGIQVFNHVVVIPDFGKLYLGELLLEKKMRTFTMMRFVLGSPVAGNITVAGGQGNGVPYP